MKRSTVLTFATMLAALSASAVVMAQSYLDAGAKARGQYGSSSASRSMNNARGYTRDYREYAQTAPKVETEVAKETTDAIGDYIVKAQKHMAWMRTQAQKGNDKDSLASLDAIDKNLADAAKAHKEMCDVCMKENIDKTGSMKCCQSLDDSLTKAINEHDKLMKHLGMANPTGTKN